jgi:formylglycine-generating enzyme required for sulfatase activity
MKSFILTVMALWFPLICTGQETKPVLNNSDLSRWTNSFDMQFALIPAGSFGMGSKLTPMEIHNRYPGGDPENYAEETSHSVVISRPFYIGVHEVTVGQFRKFIEAENYRTDAERDTIGGYGYDSQTGGFLQDSKYNWRNPGFEQDDKHPVVNVSWNDAVAFCRWLSSVDGREYRLPTEAEWEYSCRAGSTGEFAFGEDAERLVEFDNVADASLKSKFSKFATLPQNDDSIFTSRVGSYRANPFGIFDMQGNVGEWCSDWYAEYPVGPISDPIGPGEGAERVLRGGTWLYNAANCRSADRSKIEPSFRSNFFGFRIAVTSIDPSQQAEIYKNSLEMEFRVVPAQSFSMGSSMSAIQVHNQYPGGNPDIYKNEVLHVVDISQPFCMGLHEVTIGQFRKFVEAESYQTDAEHDRLGGYGYASDTNTFSMDSKYTWRNPGFEQDDMHPVVNLSWNDAVAFCQWLSRLEGRKYRLPTEAEWECCCRAGSPLEFTFSNDADHLVVFGNVSDSTLKNKFPSVQSANGSDGSLFTSRVGSFRPNAYGMFDMHGNVSEWCSDFPGDYLNDTALDPKGPKTGSKRIIRGGSWNEYPALCRSAFRGWDTPSFRHVFCGFRVVLEPEVKSKD